MGRLHIGLAVAVAAWLGSAMAVDAQVDIGPFGPGCVAEDANTSLYECTVTCDADFVFTLRVYHEGRIKVAINFHSREKIDFTELGTQQDVADSQKVTNDRQIAVG